MGNITHTITINANTSQAKANLQELQSQLKALQSIPISADVTGLQAARQEINQLTQSLHTAMNPNTGKLDLSVFSNQLAKTGKSLSDYKNALFSMGTQGQQAFLSLANAIATAEAPTNRLNQRVLQFGKTLKNTINWQLSSSLIHGIVGQVQKAINYAEKLNTSLNNIQIVTGQNNAKMAEFARQANQTAKQLSTTTTEYTNASLIYYQQGLSDKEVAKRTETTLKLANVTRQSAQVVSDQMTAIWNNYAEGSDNLEHYADVITALGAATASSSAEIAGGLEKFAAVSKTVGLSYNYATTALATIVATTRQSEDTVGTGLRTIFSRLESLKMGSTLEDGVGLTKYSAALKTAGVEILDSLGHVKDMDKILDELGAKWQTISREQQIALAQTVGGVRQYTNLMALMNNWDKFQKNLKVAEGADGTLQTQAERYASGWEAARKRVQASAEGIYDSLIDDQAIIKVTNSFAGFLDVINGLVEGFGGLKGLIPIVGSLLMGSMAKNMPEFLGNIRANWNTLTGHSVKNMSGIQNDLNSTLGRIAASSDDPVFQAQIQKIIDQNTMNQSLMQHARRMSNADQEKYRLEMMANGYAHDAYISSLQQQQAVTEQYQNYVARSKGIGTINPTKEVLDEIKNNAKQEKTAEINKINDNLTAQLRQNKTTYDIQNRETAKLIQDAQAEDQILKDLKRDIRSAQNGTLLDKSNRASAAVTQARNNLRGAKSALTRRINSQEYQSMQHELTNLENTSELVKTPAEKTRERNLRKEMAKYIQKQEDAVTQREKELAEAEKNYKDTQAEMKRNQAAQRKRAKEVANSVKEEQKQRKENADNAARDAAEAAKRQAAEKAETTAEEKERQARQAEIDKQNANLNKLYDSKELYQKEELKQYASLMGNTPLTEDTLKAAHGGNYTLTEADQKAIQFAREQYYSKMYNIGKTRGAYDTTANQIDKFAGRIEGLVAEKDTTTGQPKINTAAINAEVKEFVGKYNEAIDSQKLNLEKLNLDELLLNGSEADIEQLAQRLAKKLQQAATKAKEMAKAQSEAGGTSDQEEREVRETMTGAGIDTNTQNQILNSGRQAGETGILGTFNRPSTKPKEATDSSAPAQTAMMASAAITSALGAVNTAANGLQTALNDSASGAEKFGAILSTASTLLMTFAMTTRLANDESLKGITGKLASSAIGQTGLGQALGGAGMIGLAITMVTAIIGIIKGISQRREQQEQEIRTNNIKLGNETYEKLTQNKELQDSQVNLINAYNAAAKAVEKGTATEQELQQAKQDLIESLLNQTESGYSNKNAVAYAYAGDMQKVQAQLDQNRLQTIRAARTELITRSNASLGQLQTDFRKNMLSWYARGRGGLKMLKGSNATEQDIINRNGGNGNGELIFSYEDTPEQTYQKYKQLIQIRKEMIASGVEAKDYEAVTQMINTIASSAEEYEKYQQQLEQLNIEALGLGESIDGYYVGNANAIIKDVKTYNDYRTKLIASSAAKFGYTEGTTEYDQMVNNIDTFLGSVSSVTGHKLGNLQHISTGIENVIDYQKENYNLVDLDQQKQLRNSLINAYETYGDALFEIGTKYKLPLKFDNKGINAELQPIFDLIQARANENKIKLQLDVIANFDFSKTHSVEEWQTFFEDLNTKAWESVNGKLNKGNFVALPEFLKTEAVERYRAALTEERYGHTLDETIGAQESTLTYLNEIKAGRQQTFDNTKFAQEAENGYGWRSRDQWLQTNSSAVLEYLTLKNKETPTSDDEIRLSALTSALGKDNIEKFINSSTINDIKDYVAAFEALAKAESDVASAETDLDKSKALKSAYEEFGYNEDIANKAAALGVKYDDVLQQAYAIQHSYEMEGTEVGKVWEKSNESAQKAALALLNQQAGLETLSSNYKDWLKTLNDSNSSYTKITSASIALQQALAKIMNVDFNKVSKGLYEWAKQAGNLDKLLAGDKGAWGEAFQFQAKAALDGINNLNGDVKNKWSQFAKDQAQLDFGDQVDPHKVQEFVSDMRAAGASVQEINEAGRQVFNTTDDVLTEIGTAAVDAETGVANLGEQITKLPENQEVYITQNTNPVETEEIPLGGEQHIVGSATATGDGVLGDTDGNITISGEEAITGTATVLAANGKVKSNGTPGKQPKGGGGGGKPKPHKPKRYRVIENKIQDNDRNKERVSRDKDRAFGTAKLDLLKQQRDLEKENLKLQQQYLSEIDEWLGKDKQDLIEKMAKINFTPEFDANGIMTNMDEFEAAWAKLADGSDEAWTEAGEALDQYQETLAKYKDKLKELEEIQQAIFDSFLEETQLEVEMKINVNTANIEYIDYLLGKIEDDAYQAAEAIALLGHKTGEIEIQASVYRKGINDILSHHTLADGTQLSLENIGSMTTDQLLAAGFTDAEIQELQKYRSELLQLNQQLLEMHDTVTNKVIDSLQKMDEEVQKSYDNFDHYNSVLEHYKNINDLINIGNTKMSKEIAGKLNRAILSNAQNQVKSARKIYDAAKLNMQNAQAEYDNAVASGIKENIKHQKQILDAATEQFQKAENQWLEAWEGALEQAKAFFEIAIQDIVDTYNEQMGSTFGSLDYLQAAYDRQKETNEQYLQDYDRLYELSKLSRDISKSIDDTDSIKGKQKLRDIQAEINKLQADGTKLSQYDIEALQKKYELEKARLALEDVQNAKQTVRLQRDSEGNWGYVYTADEDKVAEAEQEYEDKLHEYQKLNDEYIQELQDKVLSAQVTYRDLIQEIMSDTTLTDEQRQARLEEVQNWYNEQINFFGQQLTNALNNQEGTLDRYYQRYNDERAKLVDSWKETTLSLLTGTGSMDDYMAHMRESASQMVETAYQALLQYKQDIDQTDAMAGQDSSFSEMVSGVVSGIGELSTATEASISTLADTMTDEFATALQAAVSWESQYVSEMMQMIAQTEAEVTAVNNLIAALSGLDTTALYAAANATVGAAGTGQASTSAANAAEQAAKATAAYSTNPYYASGEKKMTEDFLHIVNDNMVDCNVQLDDIIHMLELQVNAFSEGLGALISAPGIANEPQDILEQNIHIDVSFPNVTQHSEIEKAFENLVNKAAQYANRKN